MKFIKRKLTSNTFWGLTSQYTIEIFGVKLVLMVFHNSPLQTSEGQYTVAQDPFHFSKGPEYQ